MARKFIIDSLLYWATTYGVDGFRFDLCGLMDADTLEMAAAELHAVDPNIVLYGEPWCGGLTPIKKTEKGVQRGRGFGVFNDSLRDALRGSSFHLEETFVMDGGRIEQVKSGIIGSPEFADSPLEVCLDKGPKTQACRSRSVIIRPVVMS
jgi:pullulanase